MGGKSPDPAEGETVTALPSGTPTQEPEEIRKLVKRDVVRSDSAWIKKQKGNPNLNPRGFQVICTLSGGTPEPPSGKKPPKAIIKDQKLPPTNNIAVDVKELPNAYVFTGDVPGLKSSDIKIDLVNDKFLVITCGRARVDEADVSYIILERTMGHFVRKFMLPADSNIDAIKASCIDGILSIVVPIAPPPPEHVPKSFEIPCTPPKQQK